MDGRQQAREDSFRLLLEQAQLAEDEVVARLDKARSREYWAGLSSELSVGGAEAPPGLEAHGLDPCRDGELLEQLGREGYLQLAPMVAEPVMARMRACIDALQRERWPLVFAFMYDDFWLLGRMPSLLRLLSLSLGGDCRQTAYVWTHHVSSERGAAGWPPHKDNPGPERRLTVWIPLSDASLDSGAICLVPKDRIPPGVSERWYETERFDRAEVLALLQSARPLPARAGAVLCWEAGMLHWGLPRRRAGQPRISVSMEFIDGKERPGPREPAFLDPASRLPTLGERLEVIGRVILVYHRSEPRMLRYLGLAQRLLERPGVA